MKENSKTQSLIEHLEELRRRLIICIVSLVLISLASYPLTDDIIRVIEGDLLPPGVKVIVTTPMEAVLARFQLSLLIGLYISIPLIIYQLFAFISPALYKKERRAVILIIPGSFVLFSLGVLFAYLVMLPLMMKFLMAFAIPIAEPYLKLSEFISFIVSMAAMMGLLFQWPLITTVLARIRIISPKFWSERRRYAILLSFILGAFLTDPTFVTQILLAIPMIILYEVGIVTARLVWRG